VATTDGVVRVAPDSIGKRIDNSEVTRADGLPYERQRVNLSDPSEPNAHAAVRGEDGRGVLLVGGDVLTELRHLNASVAELLALLKLFLAS
jgi:hypothetical protein